MGKVCIQLDSVDSTNNHAKLLLSKTKPVEGTAILAREQMSGKGQRGNHWHSEPGKNLTGSYILYPTFLRASEHFLLTQSTSLAVAEVVQHFLPENTVSIKWPNDILAAGRKVCGMLIETTISGSSIKEAVIGIGLNVNQTRFEQLPNATSMKLLGNEEFDLMKVFVKLSSELEKRYLQLRAGGVEAINRAYHNLLFGLNEERTYEAKGVEFSGVIIGVNKMGFLQLDTPNGRREFSNQEVKMVW